jgi:serine/threonine protein kinase
MGELYLAASGARGMEKLCVIKTVLPSLVAMENAKRFRDEAMVVVRLSHGNLVTVFDAGRHDDQIYLAMEYVDGKDLLAVWNRCAQKRVPFPVDVAAYIVKELARGLAYAHAFGGLKLVHRDVSPANVLVSYTGEVKLTDFGLARSTLKHQHTAPGIIFGKLSYLAPEQARSEPLDGRTDIYAAGILLWELLTGQQLFPVKQPAADAGEEAKRDSTADALARVRNPQVMLPSHVTPRVPPELDAIVMRALAPEPAKRYQTGEELRADLAAFLAATTPETDAARLAAFLRPLFHDIAEKEREERDILMRGAAGLLSGAFSAEVPSSSLLAPDPDSEAAALAAAPPRSRDRTPGRRDTDLAPLGVPGGRRAGDATPLGRDGGGAVKGSGVRAALAGEDPRVGATLGGRYFIERLCGEGAMGRVYEARHIDIGRRLAIKILHSSYRHSEEVVERFRREARAASKIGHPNIVDVTDSGMTPDGAFYFVMEYLDGVDLEQLIQREGALPVERALLIAAQLCRALQAAHASEIIHRDLKPANVMLVNRKDDDDFVKVLDFGISRNMELEGGSEPGRKGLTRPDVAVGTPVYMSPEQAAGMRADALTDVYAVGGLLYEMLTATPPCAGDDVLTVLNKKATEDPPPIGSVRPDLPVEVQRLVMRALSRAPKDRQPSMAALKEDVLRCLAGGQEATAPVSPELRRPSGPRAASVGTAEPAEPRRPITERLVVFRAKPWMLGAGAVALVAIMALVSLARRESRESRAPGDGDEVVTTAVAAPRPAPAEPIAPATQPSTALPPQEPVNLKKPARVVEAAAAKTEAASPALAAPWPTESPPVFAQPKAGAKRVLVAGAPAPTKPATPPAATADELPSANAASPPAPTGDEILARGQAAFDRGNYPEAIRRAKEAIAVGASVPGHLLLADAYFHIQRYSDALREYEATLQLEPSNPLARRGRELAEKAGAAGH